MSSVNAWKPRGKVLPMSVKGMFSGVHSCVTRVGLLRLIIVFSALVIYISIVGNWSEPHIIEGTSATQGNNRKISSDTRSDEGGSYPAFRVHTPISSFGFANRAANRSPPRPLAPFQNGNNSEDYDGPIGKLKRGVGETPGAGHRNNNMITLVNAAYSHINCWRVDGTVCTAPSWAPALFTAATPITSSSLALLKKLAHVANTDPWQVIIVWVPELFIGYKLGGLTYDGVLPNMVARNPETHWREYNASWHWGYTPSSDITAADGGNRGDRKKYTYQMQLMHRNSIAVCIREQLHMRMVYLSVALSESISGGRAHSAHNNSGIDSIVLPVYYCTSREDRDEVLSNGYKAKAPLSVAHPDYISPLSTAGEAIVPPVKVWPSVAKVEVGDEIYASDSSVEDGSGTSDGKRNRSDKPCLRVEAAPWLVPTTDSFTFPYEVQGRKEARKAHDYSDLDALLRIRADPHGVIMVVFFNKYWIDLLHNFVFSLVNQSKFDNFIVATTDPEALGLCIANRLPCWDAAMYADLEDDPLAKRNTKENGQMHISGFKRKVTKVVSWVKPRLALAVLQRGYHFLMADLDMSFNGKLNVSELLAMNRDIVHQCDEFHKDAINSGFYLARSNLRTIRLFHNMMVLTPKETSDQNAMIMFVKYDHTHGVSNTCLDGNIFTSKCYFKISRSNKVIKETLTFLWNLPFNGNWKGKNWTLHHAACVIGALRKLIYLRTINAWFLDDLDAYTNTYIGHEWVKEQKYCLSFPEGTGMDNGSGARDFNGSDKMRKKYVKRYIGTLQTKHSPGYTKEKDSRYLSPRHATE
eukprot:Tbor_TRINITY_DN6207_c1_g1::TRINITY_DN6207_c1_g1_i1::g.1768::m.1768